ncbi:CoxG family protein [Bacillus rubiinfantis]|uniref:CoxG family protein n=1 Tax=Bacillus rubiinfantis TaxID=1499680 RepID=UPI0005AA3DD9|nr:SRPBCC family protein [Bacillus rubiinfantis]
MATGTYQIELDLPIEDIWNFVKDMDNWAPLVPNYLTHEKLTERQSTWEFLSEIGLIKKKISLIIDINEWEEPTKIGFTLKGKSEKYHGSGYFQAQPLQNNRTKLQGYLEVAANGKMRHIVNSKLETELPKAVKEMGQGITEKLWKLKKV